MMQVSSYIHTCKTIFLSQRFSFALCNAALIFTDKVPFPMRPLLQCFTHHNVGWKIMVTDSIWRANQKKRWQQWYMRLQVVCWFFYSYEIHRISYFLSSSYANVFPLCHNFVYHRVVISYKRTYVSVTLKNVNQSRFNYQSRLGNVKQSRLGMSISAVRADSQEVWLRAQSVERAHERPQSDCLRIGWQARGKICTCAFLVVLPTSFFIT